MKIKTITDEEILAFILSGEITAKYINRRDPIIYKNEKPYTAGLVYGSRDGNCPRYRICLEIPRVGRQRKRRKRSIVRSKIVWMIKHRKLVPEGHELHHKNEDRLHDAASNIVDWTEEQHRNYHNGVPF